MKFNRKQRTERSKTLNLSGNLNKKTPQNCSFFLQNCWPQIYSPTFWPQYHYVYNNYIFYSYCLWFIYRAVVSTKNLTLTYSHNLLYSYIKDHFLGMTEDGWFPGFVWCRCWFGSDKTSLLKEFTRTGGSTDTVTTMPATVLCTLWNDGLWHTNG